MCTLHVTDTITTVSQTHTNSLVVIQTTLNNVYCYEGEPNRMTQSHLKLTVS